MKRSPLHRLPLLARLGITAALALGCVTAGAVSDPDEAAGELVGDLIFHADLMSTLDTLCPVKGPTRDWRGVLRRVPADMRTPELRDLSRRLSADAARSMVRGSGGCGTRQFSQVYAQTRNDYESLLEKWAMSSV